MYTRVAAPYTCAKKCSSAVQASKGEDAFEVLGADDDEVLAWATDDADEPWADHGLVPFSTNRTSTKRDDACLAAFETASR